MKVTEKWPFETEFEQQQKQAKKAYNTPTHPAKPDHLEQTPRIFHSPGVFDLLVINFKSETKELKIVPSPAVLTKSGAIISCPSPRFVSVCERKCYGVTRNSCFTPHFYWRKWELPRAVPPLTQLPPLIPQRKWCLSTSSELNPFNAHPVYSCEWVY